YLQTIAAAQERGRVGALVLVPEISLTPQLAARFRARFGDAVAVLHSGLSDAERFAAWSRLQDGRVRIALGARSAVFAPVAQLGPDKLLSAPLAHALGETLAAGEQAILFLNRRGYATFVLCRACGHRFTCKDCSVTLTYHQASHRLACHYCGYLEPAPDRCP